MLAWALWDVGATGVNAIVVTFVFSVYLTGTVGDDLPSATTPQSWLFRALALSGLVVALLAPVTGIWVDAPWRRRRVLAVLTGLVVLLTSAMSLIRDDYHYLWPGLVLLACAAACSELATVPYNAMLRQLSTPETSGRISGFGWGMGYFGSVVLLLIVYLSFISGDGDTRGLLGLPIADGQNVRAAMLLAAAWFALFALPVFIVVPHPKPAPGPAEGRRILRRLSQTVGRSRRRMAPGPQHRLLPARQRGVSRRPGRGLRVRRGTRRQRVRHLECRRAAVRRKRKRDRRGRRVARRAGR